MSDITDRLLPIQSRPSVTEDENYYSFQSMNHQAISEDFREEGLEVGSEPGAKQICRTRKHVMKRIGYSSKSNKKARSNSPENQAAGTCE